VSLLVLACGNPLREDDGVGWRLAEALDFPGVDVRQVSQLDPELAEDVHAADGVVFLDARAGDEPGRVDLRPVVPRAGSLLGHAIAPEALLLCAERLYGGAPPALLLTVAGERFGHGEGLSPKVEQALPEAVRQLREVLGDGTGLTTAGPGAR
jgi:hydrogenase maturation protease